MKGALKHSVGALLAAGVASQFVPAPTDLIKKEGYAGISVRYKQVPPGICEVSHVISDAITRVRLLIDRSWTQRSRATPATPIFQRTNTSSGGSSKRATKILPRRL